MTTIDQARWRGNISVGLPQQGGQRVFSPLQGTCHEDFTIPQGQFAYVHQGAIGYVVRAEPASLTLSLRCGAAIVATDPAEAASAKWGEDRRWQAGSGFEGSDVPFAVLIDHGLDPANASYLYSIVPGVNASEMRATIFPLASEALSKASVLRNDGEVQALVAAGAGAKDSRDKSLLKSHQANSSTVHLVFRTPASAQVPLGKGGANVTIGSDRPAVLMISRDSSHWNLSVAEATRDPHAKTLTISIQEIDVLKAGLYAYSLPVAAKSILPVVSTEREYACVCMCVFVRGRERVCVCVREREREG